jgi:hypothetical protein
VFFEAEVGFNNWVSLSVIPFSQIQSGGLITPVTEASANDQFLVPSAAYNRIRIRGELTSGSLDVFFIPADGVAIVAVSNFPATAPATGLTDGQLRASPVEVTGDFSSDGLTDAELRVTPVPVSGTVNVGNFPPVQAVSGPLTDSELRASAVPVSGPLTDVQLRAAAVPVSGPLTDTQLRATPVSYVERRPGAWSANHAPAAATQATTTRATAGAGVKNICTSITISLGGGNNTTLVFVLRDGASGVGAIVWQTRVTALKDAAGAPISIPLWIEGTANTAMTLESTAAPGAAVFATVSMAGHTNA